MRLRNRVMGACGPNSVATTLKLVVFDQPKLDPNVLNGVTEGKVNFSVITTVVAKAPYKFDVT